MSADGMHVTPRPLQLPRLDRNRETESEFWDDLVVGGNELRTSVAMCSTLVPTVVEMEPKHFAVLVGLMVRLYKLFDTFLLLICDHRMEVSMIVARSACDTAIDLLYFCQARSTARLDEFITTSLAQKKKAFEGLIKDEEDGVGDTVIRERMKSSIMDDFRDAGLSLSDVESSQWRREHNARERARDCGIEVLYEHIYKNLSSVTHGSWSELIKYHLERDGESWTPNLNFAMPRPQLMSGFPLLVAKAAIAYSDSVASSTVMSDRLRTIIDWLNQMSDAHEAFLRGSD